MEPWESGLIYLFAKEARRKSLRWFESSRLRKNLKSSFPRHLGSSIYNIDIIQPMLNYLWTK